MSTTIEKAITSLVQASQPITVANALAAYLQLAGFGSEGDSGFETTEAAILAFEHALDKHPSPPPPLPTPRTKRGKSTTRVVISPPDSPSALMSMRLYTEEVAQLRKQYWTERLGNGNYMRCTCSGCGRTLKYVTEEENNVLEEAEPPMEKKRTIRRKRQSCHLTFCLRDPCSVNGVPTSQ